MLKELEGVLARAGTLLAGVERGEGALGVLLRDPDAARAVRRLVTAADGLAQAVERARATTASSARCSTTPRWRPIFGRRRGASAR